jgi:hypothetical protein
MASIGLVSLMVIPAPGIWGLLIGVACSLAILVSAFIWLLDQVATRLAQAWDRRDRRRRRAMHAGSGIMRKAGTPAPIEPPRPSPLQERARIAALRRQASKAEPFRLR